MTTEDHFKRMPAFPFICLFAQKLPELPNQWLRYDAGRQISQVFVDGAWVDTCDAPGAISASSRVTKLDRETTDDE